VTSGRTTSDLDEVAAQARRFLEAVERGDLVADDAAGRRVVEAWRLLAAGAAPSTESAMWYEETGARGAELVERLAIEAENEGRA
jgi:transcriptional regulator with AAA-type ATPase domain